MNSRIQELAENSKVMNPMMMRSDGLYVVSVDNLEKFAQLIVRDCMNCAIWVGQANTTAVEPINTADTITKRIKKTFWSA